MFKWLRKDPDSIDVVLHRPGASVVRDDRWLNIRARLSLGNRRDREIMRELMQTIADALGTPAQADPVPPRQPSLSMPASPREADERSG